MNGTVRKTNYRTHVKCCIVDGDPARLKQNAFPCLLGSGQGADHYELDQDYAEQKRS
ncbi:MAG: hypothetical protein P4L59_10830 [Desulfosporosinus sp.]|nr:hypothetical protein [Desulfosporosinus sp.]